MQYSDDLYQLIKSLSKSEKRYFKMQAALQKGEKDYLLLFDEMDVMASRENGKSEYDEGKLRSRLNGKVDSKHFHVMKNYLLGLILKSLRSLSEKTDYEEQISTLLSDARLLEQKGLYEMCLKRLDAAKSLCLKYEKYAKAIEVTTMERTLTVRSFASNVDEMLEKSKAAIERYTHLLECAMTYHDLRHRVINLYRKDARARSEQAQKQLASLLQHKHLHDESLPVTFEAKVGFYHAWALISLMKGEPENAVRHYKSLLDTWEGYPHFKEAMPASYIIYTSNYLVGCHAVHDYEPFVRLLPEIKSMPTRNLYEEAEAFQNIAFLEQLYFMNCTMLRPMEDVKTKALSLSQSIEDGLQKFEGLIVTSRRLSFFHNTIVMFFAIGNYDEVLRWAAKILSADTEGQRREVLRFARLIQLIVYTEKGEHLYIENAFKNFEYHLKKEEKKEEFEGRAIYHLRQLVTNRLNKKAILNQFKTELDGFSLHKIPGLEEITIWVESKLTNKSFLEVLRQRARIAQP